MIKRLLIANRGEIALRIIKSCNKLGIKTITLGSLAELGHPHLEFSDIKVLCQKQTPEEVYLNSDLIIATALEHKADAIHPGYGFLAEQAEFAEKVQSAGMKFIGPNPATLKTLGDKSLTRQLAISLDVPITPGYDGKEQGEKELLKQANNIGFPVLLKAVMGGGGRGMRKVLQESEFLAELKSAQQEALRLYNNSTICIEKLIENPRHIEVQVVGDKNENYIHLFERDCSIQRRFQKVIEFSPARAVDTKVLNTLYINALKVAEGAKLEGLATMEFLVSGSDIYFLEANPRIQVEHPVTEIVTGIDLVELQINIANGDSIKKINPKQINFALEARVYAEIPEQDYLPSSGRIRELNLPNFFESFTEKENIRFDHALFKGFKINQHFDPMLAKVIVKADNFEQLSSVAEQALNDCYINGIETNLPVLISLLSDLNVYTFTALDLEQKRNLAHCSNVAAIALHLHPYLINKIDPFSSNWKSAGIYQPVTYKYFVNNVISDRENSIFSISTISKNANKFIIDIDNKTLDLIAEIKTPTQLKLIIQGLQYSVNFTSLEHAGLSDIEIQINARTYHVSRTASFKALFEKGQELLLSPLPGKVTKIHALQGQKISPGDSLISIESMKIEHNIKLPQNYAANTEIELIYVEQGSNINANQELMKFKL